MTELVNIVREKFDYDKETGIFTWAKGTRNAGKTVGSLGANGYLVVNFSKKLGPLYLHRLVWLHVFGVEPPDQIDHINHIKCDNRLSNLRLATPLQNTQNISLPNKNNKLGARGVVMHPNGKFRSRIYAKGKTYEVGVFNSVSEARDAYLKAKFNLHEGVVQ